ncbi:MAG: hypothetical protein FWB91_07975 [Defluviitaleaceae bacterium]|nr:hypothetical protein [Defluviitaleaceae bacterium]
MSEIKFRWPTLEDEAMAKDRTRENTFEIDPSIGATLPFALMYGFTFGR